MSGACRAHPAHRSASASWAASVRRSAPVAVTSAIATAIAVSSVHPPAAQPNGPPPTMPTVTSSASGGPNSYPAPSASPHPVPNSTPAARSSCAPDRCPRVCVLMPPCLPGPHPARSPRPGTGCAPRTRSPTAHRCRRPHHRPRGPPARGPTGRPPPSAARRTPAPPRSGSATRAHVLRTFRSLTSRSSFAEGFSPYAAWANTRTPGTGPSNGDTQHIAVPRRYG